MRTWLKGYVLDFRSATVPDLCIFCETQENFHIHLFLARMRQLGLRLITLLSTAAVKIRFCV